MFACAHWQENQSNWRPFTVWSAEVTVRFVKFKIAKMKRLNINLQLAVKCDGFSVVNRVNQWFFVECKQLFVSIINNSNNKRDSVTVVTGQCLWADFYQSDYFVSLQSDQQFYYNECQYSWHSVDLNVESDRCW